jgi:hypothetical protein
VYHAPPGTNGVPNTTIASAPYNVWVADVAQDLNLPRPIVAGGTGATSGAAALVALGGEQAKQVVTNYDSFPFVSGSFSSAAGATSAPVSGHAFDGICCVDAADATSMFLEARDQTDGRKWVRQKTVGVWGAWALDAGGSISASSADMAAGFTGTAPSSYFVVNTKADFSGLTALSVSQAGTVTTNSGRIISALNGNASVAAYNTTVGTAAGMWVDTANRLTFGQTDGAGVPTAMWAFANATQLVGAGGVFANNDGNLGLTVITGAQTNYSLKLDANNYVFCQRATGLYGWQSAQGTSMLFDTAMNVTFGASVTAVSGYKTRAGAGGALGGNVFNINWVSPNLPMWIDGTNIGTINITTSDYRIKKDITDAPSALRDLLQWRVITYTGKKWGIFEENDNVRHSFVAHELQEISPDCVVGEKDGKQPQSLDLVPIVARMAKAIQELAAQVAELKAKQA